MSRSDPSRIVAYDEVVTSNDPENPLSTYLTPKQFITAYKDISNLDDQVNSSHSAIYALLIDFIGRCRLPSWNSSKKVGFDRFISSLCQKAYRWISFHPS